MSVLSLTAACTSLSGTVYAFRVPALFHATSALQRELSSVELSAGCLVQEEALVSLKKQSALLDVVGSWLTCHRRSD